MSGLCGKLSAVKNAIAAVPDFPKPGILFRDIFPIFKNPEIFSNLKDLLVDQVENYGKPVEAIAGLEARGFLFGPLLSLHFNIPFIPIRKKGKLPGKVKSYEYQLEYGNDVVEVQDGALPSNTRILVVDDLLATGGTLMAGVNLLNQCNYNVVGCLVIIELVDLNGRCKVPTEVKTLFEM